MLFSFPMMRRCTSCACFTLTPLMAMCLFTPQLAAQVAYDTDDAMASEGAFLDAVESQRHVAAQVMQAHVAQQLSDARNAFATDPDAAISALKSALASVEAAPELPADIRAQLRDSIVTAIQRGQRRQMQQTQQQQLAAAREAQGKQRQRLLNESTRNEEKVAQIIARYNALLDEWRFREAESAAMHARDLQPNEPTMVSAVQNSRYAGYVNDNLQVRETRHKGIVDALFAVERAHVPVGDEPPIVYPNAQVWEELTLRRRKYAAMSLEKQGSAEERIFEALQQPTTMEFIELPLADVVDLLKDMHDIEIQIEYRALEEVGLGRDTPITRNLKGISLRSALKLMLRELDLTYTVRDEVLLITTPERVAEELTAKVYPVADLVLPINSNVGANPFQMGGGLGNQGAFGGGMNQGHAGGNQMNGGNFGDLFGPNNANIGPVF